jgi:hypothetical protein
MVVRRETRREHNPVRAVNDGALEKADMLAPPEERVKRSADKEAKNGGVMKVDTGELKLPNDFTEKVDSRTRLFGLEPIALIILIFSLAFIAFITYLIAIEPPK